jgi:hypothetical protein
MATATTVRPVNGATNGQYVSPGGLTPKMTQAELMASLLDDTQVEETSERTPPLEGVASQDPDTGDIVFRFPIGEFAKHVRQTDKGKLGLALAIPGKFEVLLPRADGTYAARKLEPSWRGLWCGFSK